MANPSVTGTLFNTYIITNAGNCPLASVTVVDNRCSPVVFNGGDTANPGWVDLAEAWTCTCTATLTETTTNTVTVIGPGIKI